MEQEKIKEIKETLRRCGSGKDGCCWGCSLQDTQNIAKCTTVLCDKALTLINELESDNEKLAKAGKRVTEINEELSNAHKKIENQLKDRIAELENEKKEHGKKKFLRGWKLGIEEFSERLKDKFEHCVGDIYYADTIDERINETLKEVINADK